MVESHKIGSGQLAHHRIYNTVQLMNECMFLCFVALCSSWAMERQDRIRNQTGFPVSFRWDRIYRCAVGVRRMVLQSKFLQGADVTCKCSAVQLINVKQKILSFYQQGLALK